VIRGTFPPPSSNFQTASLIASDVSPSGPGASGLRSAAVPHGTACGPLSPPDAAATEQGARPASWPVMPLAFPSPSKRSPIPGTNYGGSAAGFFLGGSESANQRHGVGRGERRRPRLRANAPSPCLRSLHPRPPASREGARMKGPKARRGEREFIPRGSTRNPGTDSISCPVGAGHLKVSGGRRSDDQRRLGTTRHRPQVPGNWRRRSAGTLDGTGRVLTFGRRPHFDKSRPLTLR